MLIDLAAAPDLAALHADVCVVGAGAAGVTLARDLTRAGHDVCLLESGGFEYESATQALYEGANTGMDYYNLDQSRLRFFGGTTNIWGGRCTVLNDIDFQRRDWVPHSGWPLDPTSLTPFLKRAHDDMQLGEFRYDTSLWRSLGETPPFDERVVQTHFWRFDELAERFLAPRCRDLIDAPNCRVITHANVVGMVMDGNRVDRVKVRTLGGREFVMSAQRFVLACGGIENPRLLLATDVGNLHDQVGRYFMEHPHGRVGEIDSASSFALWRAFRKRHSLEVPVEPALTLSPEQQAQTRALNSAVTLKLHDRSRFLHFDKKLYLGLKHRLAPTKTNRTLWRAYKNSKNAVRKTVGERWKHLKTAAGTQRFFLMVRAEQAPNPASRVHLDLAKDPLGVPKANLDWRLSAIDKHTVRTLAHTFDSELRRLGLGQLRPAPWLADEDPQWPVDPDLSNHPIGGYHHMGTTRMSLSPREGVVDVDGRVHGMDNLYVSGSSVFPTGGWANPTLTIMALAHRLADHLTRN